ncbi:hypothetical protein H6F86_05630 [Phormidium sp. FACHB-592]|uniref:Uncharacterized protein n=1 Tax=Stenomitos frigidus AS-A4 TaxID=2933935 RepID=A0ABV0KP44_9CYAN|nr:hypothetical protein [Phormidium sp. FACHB-592]
MKRRVLLSLSPILLSALLKPSRLAPCPSCGEFHLSTCVNAENAGGKPHVQT